MSTLVVLISGKQGSGKDTVAGLVSKSLENYHAILDIRLKFADVIYEMHDACIQILAKYGITRDIQKDGYLLQLLGTEWGRNTISEDIWCEIARKKVEVFSQHSQDKAGYKHAVFMFTDCRFPNEFEAFHDAFKVRLKCPEIVRRHRAAMWRETTDHPSEVSLDKFEEQNLFDLVIDTEKNDENKAASILTRAILNELHKKEKAIIKP